MTNDTIKSRWEHLYPTQVIAEIEVVEPSTDATLSFLSVASDTLIPPSDSTITNYVVCVGKEVLEVRISATPTDPNATLSGDIGVVQLASDTNVFTITVTAEDGITTKDYIVTVIKGCNVSIAEIKNEQLTIKIVEVYDILGRKVYTSQHSLSFGEGWGEVLPKGIYIIKIQTNKGIIIKKISK
jgi:hypothetical protein